MRERMASSRLEWKGMARVVVKTTVLMNNPQGWEMVLYRSRIIIFRV